MQLQNNESWCFTGSKDFRSLVALSSQYSLLYNPESEAERLSEGCFLLSSDRGIKPFLCKSRKTGINTLTVSNKGTSPELSPALNVHLCLVDWQHNKTWQENRWQFLFCDEGMRALHRYLGNGVMAHTSGACSEGAFAAWLELTVGSFGSVFWLRFSCSVELAKTMEKSFWNRGVKFLSLPQKNRKYLYQLYGADMLGRE